MTLVNSLILLHMTSKLPTGFADSSYSSKIHLPLGQVFCIQSRFLRNFLLSLHSWPQDLHVQLKPVSQLLDGRVVHFCSKSSFLFFCFPMPPGFYCCNGVPGIKPKQKSTMTVRFHHDSKEAWQDAGGRTHDTKWEKNTLRGPHKIDLLQIDWWNRRLKEEVDVAIKESNLELVPHMFLRRFIVCLWYWSLQGGHDSQKTSTTCMNRQCCLCEPGLLHSHRLPVPVSLQPLNEQLDLTIHRVLQMNWNLRNFTPQWTNEKYKECRQGSKTSSSALVSSTTHAHRAPDCPLLNPRLKRSLLTMSWLIQWRMPLLRVASRRISSASLLTFVCKLLTACDSLGPSWKARATWAALFQSWGVKLDHEIQTIQERLQAWSWNNPRVSDIPGLQLEHWKLTTTTTNVARNLKTVCVASFLENLQLAKKVHSIWQSACVDCGHCSSWSRLNLVKSENCLLHRLKLADTGMNHTQWRLAHQEQSEPCQTLSNQNDWPSLELTCQFVEGDTEGSHRFTANQACQAASPAFDVCHTKWRHLIVTWHHCFFDMGVSYAHSEYNSNEWMWASCLTQIKEPESGCRKGRGVCFSSSHASVGAMIFSFSTPGSLGSVLNLVSTKSIANNNEKSWETKLERTAFWCQETPASAPIPPMPPCQMGQTFQLDHNPFWILNAKHEDVFRLDSCRRNRRCSWRNSVQLKCSENDGSCLAAPWSWKRFIQPFGKFQLIILENKQKTVQGWRWHPVCDRPWSCTSASAICLALPGVPQSKWTSLRKQNPKSSVCRSNTTDLILTLKFSKPKNQSMIFATCGSFATVPVLAFAFFGADPPPPAETRFPITKTSKSLRKQTHRATWPVDFLMEPAAMTHDVLWEQRTRTKRAAAFPRLMTYDVRNFGDTLRWNENLIGTTFCDPEHAIRLTCDMLGTEMNWLNEVSAVQQTLNPANSLNNSVTFNRYNNAIQTAQSIRSLLLSNRLNIRPWVLVYDSELNHRIRSRPSVSLCPDLSLLSLLQLIGHASRPGAQYLHKVGHVLHIGNYLRTICVGRAKSRLQTESHVQAESVKTCKLRHKGTTPRKKFINHAGVLIDKFVQSVCKWIKIISHHPAKVNGGKKINPLATLEDSFMGYLLPFTNQTWDNSIHFWSSFCQHSQSDDEAFHQALKCCDEGR